MTLEQQQGSAVWRNLEGGGDGGGSVGLGPMGVKDGWYIVFFYKCKISPFPFGLETYAI